MFKEVLDKLMRRLALAVVVFLCLHVVLSAQVI
jgi:hypothetical protein